MKTISLKKSEIQKNWWIVDAKGAVLGRLASEVAQILRGKHKTNFTPHLDMGDCVIVINAEKIEVTGNKEKDKKYFSHTGYPGGGKETSLEDLRQSKPEEIIQKAIDTLTKGKTSIVIAHRLATVKNADRIVVMDQGQIVEVGTHKELLQVTQGHYAKLYEVQFADVLSA